MRTVRRLVLLLVLLAAVAAVAWAAIARPRRPAAERGRRLAERSGCFACHGPGGIRGVPNRGRSDRTVPGFEGDVMMYAHDAEDVREWIRDGVPKRKAGSTTWQEQRRRGVVAMPAFGRRFSARQLDDLVAYVDAMAGEPAPEDSDTTVAAGLAKAEALACTGCHGAGGRLALRNPGSLKGYVPSWDGADFAELVRDRAEFGQWVEHGVSDRFRANAAARFFLRRAALHMPGYAAKGITHAEVDTLWAYVSWLRRTPH